MRRALLLILLTAVTGCASLDDIRASQPVREGTFAGNYVDISGCVADALMPTTPVVQNVRPRLNTATVTYIHDSLSSFPLWEAVIHQTGPDGGTAEIRAMKTVWGTPHGDALVAWKVFEGCGVTTAAH